MSVELESDDNLEIVRGTTLQRLCALGHQWACGRGVSATMVYLVNGELHAGHKDNIAADGSYVRQPTVYDRTISKVRF